MSERRSPGGLKFICVLWALGSILGLFMGFILIAASGEAPEASGLVLFLGLLAFGISLAQFISIFGLWSLKMWGYQMAKAVVWIALVGGVITLFTGNFFTIIGLIINIIILVYITNRRHLFEIQSPIESSGSEHVDYQGPQN